MENSKRVSIALTEDELGYVRELRNRFKEKFQWNISRHALLRMVLASGLEVFEEKYAEETAIAAI